ncbi:MAG: PstS family phosphate ABC transporter substrate-binding protein [Petrotogales bacterium]
MGEAKNKKLGKLGITLLITIILIAVVFTGCIQDGTQKTVTVKGSSTVLPIAETCAEEFMKANPDVQVTVASGGSSVGIKAVANGEVDIGDASRDAKPSDVEDIEGVDFEDLIDHVVAYDGIAVVVSPTIYEDVKNLTMTQVYHIYTGEISNWNEIDGPDAEIFVNDRGSTSGTRATFVELITNDTGYSLEDFEEDGGKLAKDKENQENANVVTSVSGADNAIGYVGFGYINQETCPAVAVDGILPSTTTVKDGSYPISRSLHMYTLGEATGVVKDFIDFVQSADGQKIVEDEGFIAIT